MSNRQKDSTTLSTRAQAPRITYRGVLRNLRNVANDPDARAELIETAEALADELEEAADASV